MQCTQCHNQLPPGAAHCVFCGAPLPAGPPGQPFPAPPKAPAWGNPPSRARTKFGSDLWLTELRTALLALGILLLACFIAPWALTKDGPLFAWSALQAPGSAKLFPLAVLVTAILSIGSGLLLHRRTMVGVAATFAAALGLTLAFVGTGEGFARVFNAISIAVLAMGLLVRAQRAASRGALVLVFVSSTMLLTDFFIHHVRYAFSGGFLSVVGGLGLPVLAAIALGMTLRPNQRADAALGWAVLIWAGVGRLLGAMANEGVTGALSVHIYLPVALSAWLSLLALGGLTLAGTVILAWGSDRPN